MSCDLIEVSNLDELLDEENLFKVFLSSERNHKRVVFHITSSDDVFLTNEDFHLIETNLRKYGIKEFQIMHDNSRFSSSAWRERFRYFSGYAFKENEK